VHAEAIICLYQVNEFGFWIEKDDPRNHENRSIMGRWGYKIYFGHSQIYQERLDESFFDIPRDMVQYLQQVVLNIGTQGGLREFDIVPTKRQTTLGPERPSFQPLLSKVEGVCGLLKKCKNIHLLRLSIRSIEKTPGSIEMVMDPIRKLRGIKKTHAVVFAMQEDKWVDWNLKGSYGRYMSRILEMPKGGVAPKYVGDEKEPDQSEDDIFDMIGGRWLGGRRFEYEEDGSEPTDEEWDEQDHIANAIFDQLFQYVLGVQLAMSDDE
jgi:hypothetical protein